MGPQQQPQQQQTQGNLPQQQAIALSQNFQGHQLRQTSQISNQTNVMTSQITPQTNVIQRKTSNPGDSRIHSLHQACLSRTSPAGPQPQIPNQTTTIVGGKRCIPDDFSLPPAQKQS